MVHELIRRHIAQLNSQLSELQRQRFELQQEEQRQLSTFLNPLQQAQYLGLQAQLRQRVQNFRINKGMVTLFLARRNMVSFGQS